MVVFPICGMEVKSPERSHSESASPSSVANAMAHISVYCADKMKMQFEMNQNEDNSNDLLDNIGAKVCTIVINCTCIIVIIVSLHLHNCSLHMLSMLLAKWRLNIMVPCAITQTCVTNSSTISRSLIISSIAWVNQQKIWKYYDLKMKIFDLD